MSWWTVAAAALVIAGVARAATVWLLREAVTAEDPGAAGVEAIKTGPGAFWELSWSAAWVYKLVIGRSTAPVSVAAATRS